MAEEKHTQDVSKDEKIDTPKDDTQKNDNTDKNIKEDDSKLNELSKDELTKIISDTRAEAKNRRLKNKELETKLEEINNTTKLNEQVQLEKNEKWEEAYNKIKEDTKQYDEFKNFKTSYLETCKEKIDEVKPKLTKAEQELFDLSSENMSFDNQLKFIDKLINNRQEKTNIDNTQSTARGGNENILTDKPIIPFGNARSVIGKLMSSLKTAKSEEIN